MSSSLIDLLEFSFDLIPNPHPGFSLGRQIFLRLIRLGLGLLIFRQPRTLQNLFYSLPFIGFSEISILGLRNFRGPDIYIFSWGEISHWGVTSGIFLYLVRRRLILG